MLHRRLTADGVAHHIIQSDIRLDCLMGTVTFQESNFSRPDVNKAENKRSVEHRNKPNLSSKTAAGKSIGSFNVASVAEMLSLVRAALEPPSLPLAEDNGLTGQLPTSNSGLR